MAEDRKEAQQRRSDAREQRRSLAAQPFEALDEAASREESSSAGQVDVLETAKRAATTAAVGAVAAGLAGAAKALLDRRRNAGDPEASEGSGSDRAAEESEDGDSRAAEEGEAPRSQGEISAPHEEQEPPAEEDDDAQPQQMRGEEEGERRGAVSDRDGDSTADTEEDGDTEEQEPSTEQEAIGEASSAGEDDEAEAEGPSAEQERPSAEREADAPRAERDERARDGDESGDEQQEQSEERTEARGTTHEEAAETVDQARAELRQLVGVEPESVSGFERKDGHWTVTLEVVEVRRIPDSTDVMSSYEVVLDGDRNVVSMARTRRYRRGQVEE